MGRRFALSHLVRVIVPVGAIDALSLNFTDISSPTANDSEISLLNMSAWKII